MSYLVNGIVATGEAAFHPGQSPAPTVENDDGTSSTDGHDPSSDTHDGMTGSRLTRTLSGSSKTLMDENRDTNVPVSSIFSFALHS